MSKAKKIFSLVMIVLLISVFATVQAFYIPNNRDTQQDPKPMEFEEITFDPLEYKVLASNVNFEYRYRAKTDVFVIKDKRNGYSWKTGIDSLTKSQLEDLIDSTDNKKENLLPAPTMSNTYVERANSAISVAYYDQAFNLKYLSSNNAQVQKSYKKATTDNNTYCFTYKFARIELEISVYLTFTTKGLSLSIPDEGVTGKGQKTLTAIEVFPFLGATGGEFIAYDFADEANGYDNEDLIFKPQMIDGYSVIPDGSGALVRFKENTQEFSTIELPVYGQNVSANYYNFASATEFFVEPNASLPMYGMVHGLRQNAYLGYADEGSEYMSIVSTPYGLSNVFYNWTYAKFTYNYKYFQVFNKAGQGKTSMMSERYHFDINMNYEFLCEEDEGSTLSADYIGIANAYKNVIKDSFITTKKESKTIPIRIDFLMSDTKPGIFGLQNVVVTNSMDVDKILAKLRDQNITNINSGLYGYQDGGVTSGSKKKVNYDSSVGSKKDYKNLIAKYQNIGIDISFFEDYYYFNTSIMKQSGNAAKHYNGLYDTYSDYQSGNTDVDTFNYLKPKVAYSSASSQIKQMIKDTNIVSMSIKGISNNVLSDYAQSTKDGMSYYEKIFKETSDKVAINASKPNGYLWPYITRYLNASAFNSQYLVETDSIPLLSFILNDYVEVYADYSNFSFYDTPSILRMIDYNLLPSFVLTNKSSHYLVNTNSNKYYSTEYNLYEARINAVYKQVNTALSSIYNSSWTNRLVLTVGVIKNDYSNNKSVIINYTNEDFNYQGTIIKALSSVVITND